MTMYAHDSNAPTNVRCVLEFLPHGVVSSTFFIVQILVHSHFDLVSSFLAVEATESVSEPVTQMVLELINNHVISVQCSAEKEIKVKSTVLDQRPKFYGRSRRFKNYGYGYGGQSLRPFIRPKVLFLVF